MKRSVLWLVASMLPVVGLAPAQAGSRYATPPPLTLSADVSEPWTLQLRGGQVRKLQQYRGRKAKVRSRLVSRRKLRVPAPSAPPVRRAALRPSQARSFDRTLLPTRVSYETAHKPGTIVVDTIQRRLFLVEPGGMALRYGIGVGKPGFEWRGKHKVTRKQEWPTWTPPKEMIAREAAKGRILPAFMEGGPDNPMGARALYLGSTLYRIHGTNQDWSIGHAVSSGCIRMRNEDVMDLFERVRVGTQVVVI